MRRRCLGLLALLVVAACAPAMRELRRLDAAHGVDFERAFDGARGHERFVVALSPT